MKQNNINPVELSGGGEIVKQRTLNNERLMIRKQVFACPHCGERISMLLDLSAGYQRYIEDCEVCCSPIEISYQAEEGALVSFQAGIP
jgi:transcription elongation factor Elf1